MRVALVGPKWHEMVNSYPSLGLAYLAAIAEQEGHTAAVFDMGLRPKRPVADEVEDIVAWRPDVIAFTSMTTSYQSVEEAVALLKARLGPQVPIILGGPHATTLPELALQNPHIDFLVYGEGEYVFRDWLRQVERGDTNWAANKGLWYKDAAGRVVDGGERELIPDLDELPFPARHLFDLKAYPLYAPTGEQMVTVLTSRGCPYKCSFCFKGIVGRTYRQRSPENIVAELRQLIDQYGVRNFYFMDDLFTINVKRLEAILDYFIEQDLDVRWRCLARVDRVTPDLLRKMYRAGCRQIHFGIESGNPEILKKTAKHIDLDQVRQAIEWTEDAGIMSKGYFILGLPGDNEQTMQETIEFAASLRLSEAMFSIATPMPGTELWEELIHKNPDTVYNTDFTKSYYYNSYTSEIAPFMNVSDVSDDKLSKMAIQARRRFLESKEKRKYLRYFGPMWGERLYRVSQVGPIKNVGRKVLNLGLFPRFRSYQPKQERAAWE
jgi:anaerobic magnesium-protoporphyrin IX monomethyl ester cyclase